VVTPEISLPRGLSLRHRQAARPASDYRGAPERAELLIERRFFHGGHLVGAVCLALSAAILGGFWWHRVSVAQSFHYGTPGQFWLGAGVIVAFGLFLATRFGGLQTIVVTQDSLVVSGGGRDQAVSAPDIAQLFTRHLDEPPYGYQVMLTLQSGETLLLVGNLDLAEQARYVERQIEETLELPDQTVPAELPRSAPGDALPDRSRIPSILAAVGLLVGTSTLAVSSRGCAQPLGVLPVDVLGGETSLVLDLDRDRSLQVLADVTLGGRYVRTHSDDRRSTQDLPKTLRVEIAIDQGEVSETVECDPLDVFAHTNRGGSSSWSLYGTARNCRLPVHAGSATLRARLTGDIGDDFSLQGLTLVPAR
jgi:hypothetical protein